MHLAAGSLDFAFVQLEVEVEVLQSVILDRPAGFAQRLELRQPLDSQTPPQRKPGSRQTQRALQILVGQAGLGCGLEIAAGREHRRLPRRADRRDSVGHAGENLGHVANFDLPALPVEFARHVEQTAEISGQNRFGAGCGDVGRLVGHHLVGNFRVFDAEGAAKAAAHFRPRQFLDAQTANGCEKLARLELDAELAQDPSRRRGR